LSIEPQKDIFFKLLHYHWRSDFHFEHNFWTNWK